MNYSISELRQLIKGDYKKGEQAKSGHIEQVLIDSRHLFKNQSSLFFCLIGPHFNGHTFIRACYQAGVRAFVVSEQQDVNNFPKAHFFEVSDTLQTLQTLANAHRSSFQIPIIGITGSNGKTIVKEWLWQLLHQKQKIVRSPQSYNSQVGVPLSVLQMEQIHDLGIFEAGISQPAEMAKLAAVIQPTIGIFTNIGSAHDQGFASRTEKIQEKLALFEHAELLIYCGDYDQLHQLIQVTNQKTFYWTKHDKEAAVQLKQVSFEQNRACLTIQFKQQISQCWIPFSDAASVENAMHCICLLLYWGYDLNDFLSIFEQLEAVQMRLEIKEGIDHCTLINDSYNNDLQSLLIALNVLEQRAEPSKRALILSDILQSRLSKEELYQTIAQHLKQKEIHCLIGVGGEVKMLSTYVPSYMQTHFFENTDELLSSLKQFTWKQHTILIKGARKFGFERLAARLSKKIHLTVLEVNLAALRHNLSQYRSLLKADTRLMVMVKAAAYGSGALEVARLLEQQRVDY